MPAALRSDLLVVAGQRQAARDGATSEVLAPATGEPFARVARAGPEDVELALAAADAAFDDGRGPWPSTSATTSPAIAEMPGSSKSLSLWPQQR